jgi:SEC-C motif
MLLGRMLECRLIRNRGSVMFADCRTDDELPRPSAEMLRVLRAAGCDTTNEHDLQKGLVAYSGALLVCRQAASNTTIQPGLKSRTGRNEPCPCGSGKKYKKCCLDRDHAPLAGGDRAPPPRFGPEVVPRLWDQDAVFADCSLLSRIMERDPALVHVGFSPEKVASFADTLIEQEGSLFGDATDDATREQAIDDLAVRYMRESGDRNVTRGIKDKFLAAARRAQSKAELRSLATGICFALTAEVTKDPADDLLSIILFRKVLFDVAREMRVVAKIADQLDLENKEELCRLIETNDPSIKKKLESVAATLSTSEADTLRAIFDKRHDNLWDAIEAEEFPVPMPCGTQIALIGRLASAQSDEKCSHDDLARVIEAFCDELIADDYLMYGQMLDRWLKNSNGQPNWIVDAVKMMRELCGIRSIAEFVPTLLIHCLRTHQMIPLDEEEGRLIESYRDLSRVHDSILEYSSWLRTKGHAGMADRLLLSWENVDLPSEAQALRKSNAA